MQTIYGFFCLNKLVQQSLPKCYNKIVLSVSIKEKIGLLYCKFLYERRSARIKNKAFYKNLLPANQLCFDVGGNVGGRTKAFLETGAQVVCIEPQSIFYKYLQKQFENNNKVNLENLAIGAKKDILELQISSLYPTVSTLADKRWIKEVINGTKVNVEYDKTEQVEVETLDYLINKYGLPYFCKIDVEGFEYQVLQGLSQKIALLSFEFFNYDMKNTNLCLNRLSELGYTQFNWSIGEKQKFEIPVWGSVDDLLKDIEAKNSNRYSGDIYAK